ncbi:hypothetical protein [Scytonema sp. NUACC26]|uniref:hypothetical protein n=1 Tax=Scytonema sp. NUACC26 TaxID=3140176 RepID=UPI0034DB9BBD
MNKQEKMQFIISYFPNIHWTVSEYLETQRTLLVYSFKFYEVTIMQASFVVTDIGCELSVYVCEKSVEFFRADDVEFPCQVFNEILLNMGAMFLNKVKI